MADRIVMLQKAVKAGISDLGVLGVACETVGNSARQLDDALTCCAAEYAGGRVRDIVDGMDDQYDTEALRAQRFDLRLKPGLPVDLLAANCDPDGPPEQEKHYPKTDANTTADRYALSH